MILINWLGKNSVKSAYAIYMLCTEHANCNLGTILKQFVVPQFMEAILETLCTKQNNGDPKEGV